MKNKANEFQTLLEYDEKRHLVGVKFLFSKEEYDNQMIKEATHQMFFCMMVKAATIGHQIKVTKKHLYCSAAAQVLGFKEPDEDTLSGKTSYKRNMYCNEHISESVSKEIPYLNHNIYGMVVQPLEMFLEAPDIVLSFCKPYTAMRIIQGYSYKYGFAKNIRFSGMGGVCTEMMARSYKNKDINISFLCSGTRFSAEWKDDEVGIAFPYEMFISILDGIRSTINTFEPDNKKKEIIERAKKSECSVEVEMGNNYYDSCLGVAKIGVEGYYPKKD